MTTPTPPTTRLGNDYFERIYARSDDPWGFESSWYERRKYDLTLAVLPRPTYRSAFEPGASIGVLTELLAARCERLLALEALPRVAERARLRVAHLDRVEVRVGAIPEDWPDGRFDLVVLSEVAYYLNEGGLEEALDHLVAALEPSGTLVATHWRGETDYPLRGDAVHATIDARPELVRSVTHVEDAFRLEVWGRR